VSLSKPPRFYFCLGSAEAGQHGSLPGQFLLISIVITAEQVRTPLLFFCAPYHELHGLRVNDPIWAVLLKIHTKFSLFFRGLEGYPSGLVFAFLCEYDKH